MKNFIEQLTFWLFVIAGVATGVAAILGLKKEYLLYAIGVDFVLFIIALIAAGYAAERSKV